LYSCIPRTFYYYKVASSFEYAQCSALQSLKQMIKCQEQTTRLHGHGVSNYSCFFKTLIEATKALYNMELASCDAYENILIIHLYVASYVHVESVKVPITQKVHSK
jgi:hypothetical protein